MILPPKLWTSRPNTQKWIENQNLRYPISGLVYCGECGGKCGAQGSKHRGGQWHSYYKCRNAMHHKSCSQNRTIRNDRIEAAIVDALVKAANEINQVSQIKPTENTIASPELATLREQLAGLIALGNNPTILSAIDGIRSQIRQLEFTETSKEQKIFSIREDFADTFSDAEYWENALLSSDRRTIIFNRFIKKVILFDGQIVDVLLNF